MEREELIKIEDIAAAFQGLLGNKFIVCVDSMLDVDELKIPVIMYATRQPYKLKNIDTETIQLGFEARVECSYKKDYEDSIAGLSKLLGYNKINFESNNKSYNIYSFLDFSRPLSSPVVDSGTFQQTLVLTGNSLICGSRGAIVGNDIETYFIFNPEDEEKKWEGKVEVLNYTGKLVKSSESPQMANMEVAKTFNTSQVYSYTYVILILKNKVGERLFKAAEGIEPFELNERVDTKKNYPSFFSGEFSATKELCITEITPTILAGAFITVQVTFQDRLNIEDLEINNG